jgi:hypothetical protein
MQTKYLNQIYSVERGQYDELGMLIVSAVALGFVIPIVAIALFGRKV